MKTPMQELLETFEEMRSPIDSKVDVDFAISLVKSMLEKEKEMMCGFGENVRGAMLKSDKHRTTEEVYNETFKTKEK